MILAFDTSSARCAAAVIADGQVLASAEEHMAKGQAERLLVLCEELLDQAGGRFADLTAVGVGVGPGNFTGIRISVSAARGLTLGLGIPAVGVSAFDALRFGQAGPCACAVDARRDQVYLQIFDGASSSKPELADLHNLPPYKGPLIGHTGQSPRYQMAEAIGLIAQERYASETSRPAPLYLRPADAAPARDQAPTILP